MNEPTTADLLDLLDELRARRVTANGQEGEWEPPTPIVDWVEAYGGGEDPARWLAEPLLPHGGSVALFAKGGTGKSLFALWVAAGLATGTSLVGPVEPVDVLYLDYEMTLTTVVERLEAMGYTDPLALKRFYYCSLPVLAPLDTRDGGLDVVDMARRLGVALVVIDTFGRAVDGEEDRADTVRAWYRWTGQLLKAAGVGFLRIDHAGKDQKRGQRGTSAKNDDVDVVWEMTERGHGEYVLRATKRRVDWVEAQVVLRQTKTDGVLAYRWDDGGVSHLVGTEEVAAQLDDLGAPLDISRRRATALLREHGHGRANNVVADALRYRRESASTTSQYHLNQLFDEGAGTASGTATNPQVVPPEYQSVPVAEPTDGGVDTYVVRAPHRGHVPLLFDDLGES